MSRARRWAWAETCWLLFRWWLCLDAAAARELAFEAFLALRALSRRHSARFLRRSFLFRTESAGSGNSPYRQLTSTTDFPLRRSDSKVTGTIGATPCGNGFYYWLVLGPLGAKSWWNMSETTAEAIPSKVGEVGELYFFETFLLFVFGVASFLSLYRLRRPVDFFRYFRDVGDSLI